MKKEKIVERLKKLREGAESVRGSLLPKSITPEMVGGPLSGIVDSITDLINGAIDPEGGNEELGLMTGADKAKLDKLEKVCYVRAQLPQKGSEDYTLSLNDITAKALLDDLFPERMAGGQKPLLVLSLGTRLYLATRIFTTAGQQTLTAYFEAPDREGTFELTLADKAADCSLHLNPAPNPRQSIIDQWNEACKYPGQWTNFDKNFGRYDPETDTFSLNEIHGIGWEEAMEILALYPLCRQPGCDWSGKFNSNLKVRTLFPIVMPDDMTGNGVSAWVMFRSCINLEKIVFTSYNVLPDTLAQVNISDGNRMFIGCGKLKEVKGILNVSPTNSGDIYPWLNNVDALTTIYIKGVKFNYSRFVGKSLSLESVRYLVDNAENTSAITVTVHGDVYAALTGRAAWYPFNEGTLEEWTKLLSDATAKNISFATA